MTYYTLPQHTTSKLLPDLFSLPTPKGVAGCFFKIGSIFQANRVLSESISEVWTHLKQCDRAYLYC